MIQNGIFFPVIFQEFSDHIGVGVTTKIFSRTLARNGVVPRIRVTGDMDRFDKAFFEASRKQRIAKIGAGRILAQALRYISPTADPHTIIKTRLVHGTTIATVTEQWINVVRDSTARQFGARCEADGIITNLRNVPLMVTGADCPPIVLFDPDMPAIGVLHSGYKGILGEIALRGVQALHETYGSQPSRILAYIGPHADKHSYEVDDRIFEAFANARDKRDRRIFSPYDMTASFVRRPDNSGKYLFNMSAMIIRTLLKAGVHPEHIEVSEYSTMAHNYLFSSERVEGKDKRDALVILAALK